jgi:hypothetical protein
VAVIEINRNLAAIDMSRRKDDSLILGSAYLFLCINCILGCPKWLMREEDNLNCEKNNYALI